MTTTTKSISNHFPNVFPIRDSHGIQNFWN